MFQLKRRWRKFREDRNNKKQRRTSQSSSENSSPGSKGSMTLDETKMIAAGLGVDPRFIKNPHGIGSSRTYEESYESVMQSLSTSPASSRPNVPQDIGPRDNDGLLPFANLRPPKPANIDMAKGKRKGRMPGDSADDRYKYLLDSLELRFRSSARRRRSSAERSSARRSSWIRQRKWSC